MKFSIISDAFQKMEATSKRLELTEILVELIKEIPEDVISKAVYLIQGKLRPNFEGVELRDCRKACNESNVKIIRHTIKKNRGGL